MSLFDEFLARTGSPTQAQIDWLKRKGVKAMTLVRDGDGDGFPLGVARVEQSGKRFEFRAEDGVGAYLFVARDEDGEVADIVAWAPRAGWAAPWRGHAAMLGQHEVLAPRMGEPLPVHRDVLGSEIARAALGVEHSRLGTADQRRIAAILERLSWKRLAKDWKGNRPWGLA